jgi:SAM-dependent methyltransferase
MHGRIIGVDISDEFLTQARELTAHAESAVDTTYDYRKIVTVRGKEVIPIDDGTVDAVSTTIVLQEMQTELQLINALEEMGRIAKPGARLAAACVSALIINEDYTTFTYAGFPENVSNAASGNNIRQCASTVSKIVWDHDRHWSADILMSGFRRGGWTQLNAEYPLAATNLRPFPTRPEVEWKDETRVAPLVLIAGIRL